MKCPIYLSLGLHFTIRREKWFLLCTNLTIGNWEEVGGRKGKKGYFLLCLSTRNILHLFTYHHLTWWVCCKITHKETKITRMELNYLSLVATDSSRLGLNCDFLPQNPLFISRHQSAPYFWINAGGAFEKRRQTRYRNEELFVSLRVIF